MITLTQENYYDPETDWDYRSFSQFKEFEKCEAAAVAKLNGAYKDTSNPTALLVGNYVHSYFESGESHRDFLEKNADSMISTRGKTKGQLKSEYKVADSMINALQHDSLFNEYYAPGKKEVIVTGKIGGSTWKGKIDSLSLEKGYFCDLKTTRDIYGKNWTEEFQKPVSFVMANEYIMQLAIYRELIQQTFGETLDAVIFAVSKETPANKVAIDIDDGRYGYEIEKINQKLPEYEAVMNGQKEPTHCGKCEWCRAHKDLTDFVEVGDLLK